MKIQLLIVIATLLLSSYPAAKVAGQTPGNDFNWRGKIAAGGLVEIVAISGDIRIEIVEQGELEVVALKQGNESEFDRVHIQVKESAGGIKVCAAYLAMEEQGKYECPALEIANPIQFDGNRQLRLGFENGKTQTFQLADIRTQLRVRIPRGTRLAARTHTGNVGAEWLTKVAPAQMASIDLSSHIGNVRLTLPKTIDARVQMATASGAITTDFPVTVPGGFRGKGLEGNLGQGGPRIALSTHVGNVELSKERDAKSPAPSSADFTWRGNVDANGAVEIIGISGDIQAEVYDGEEVEVVALKQGNKNGFDQVQIRVEESAGRVRICAAYPLLDEQGRSECLAVAQRRDVANMGGREIHVRSDKGNKQSFRLDGVRVQFKVRIPSRKSFGAQVQFETTNEIATDFPITVLGRFSENGLEGTIGQGGLKLTLQTILGNVELRRAQ